MRTVFILFVTIPLIVVAFYLYWLSIKQWANLLRVLAEADRFRI